MTDWIRTTKTTRCPVCGKDHWCLINPTAQLVLCMRVQSRSQKQFKDGQMGWLHPLQDRPDLKLPSRQEQPETPIINCRRLIEEWGQTTKPEDVDALAKDLHVSANSMNALQFCWSPEHRAWAIPMKDGYDTMVGIRLRAANGDKWAVRGSHTGCFIPHTESKPLALVAEGPTDTCAGLDLGFYTCGRPAASGGIQQLKQLFRRKGVRRAAVVCDNDAVGVTGARIFTEQIGIPTCTIVLPTKDLRGFVECGGDASLMNHYIQNAIWKNA